MYANITQYLAAERARDLREQAAAARLWFDGGRAGPPAPPRRAPLGLRRRRDGHDNLAADVRGYRAGL